MQDFTSGRDKKKDFDKIKSSDRNPDYEKSGEIMKINEIVERKKLGGIFDIDRFVFDDDEESNNVVKLKLR